MERIDPVAAPAQRLVTMGRVLGAHGVRGALMVASFCEPPRRLLDYSPWWMVRNGVPSTVRVVRGQDSTKGLIVEIEGLTPEQNARVLPLLFGAGWVYLLGAAAGGAHFVLKARALALAPSRKTAMASFFASMVQLSLLLAAVAIDAALR